MLAVKGPNSLEFTPNSPDESFLDCRFMNPFTEAAGAPLLGVLEPVGQRDGQIMILAASFTVTLGPAHE